MAWISNFKLLKLVIVDKKDEKIKILTLEVKTLLSREIVFVCCQLAINKVKEDEIVLLVCQSS